jgi:hypothetical protein
LGTFNINEMNWCAQMKSVSYYNFSYTILIGFDYI